MAATGTFRSNRTSVVMRVLIDSKSLKKKEREAFDYSSDGNIYMCRWNDHTAVGVVSNYLMHEPLHMARRCFEVQSRKMLTSHILFVRTTEEWVKLISSLEITDRPSVLFPILCQWAEHIGFCWLAFALEGFRR